MDTIFLTNVLGFSAAGIGAVMFFPQVVKCYKTKQTKDISFLSCSLLATASFLWLGYGLLTVALPIIFVNSVILVLSLFLLILKRKYG